MAHVRTQIRYAFKDALDAALPPLKYRVFASRKSAINHQSAKALVDMRFLNDQTRQEETMVTGSGQYARIHVASFYVRIQRSAAEIDIDNLLDEDELLVVQAIEGFDWSALLEEEPELVQVNFPDDGSTESIIGGIVLRYDLEYRINKDDPETVIS